ncbi:MAG: xanthan lyase [Muribaculaceae bacterium]|nr:xanthan lyase [Muribaculaceae bacterium]
MNLRYISAAVTAILLGAAAAMATPEQCTVTQEVVARYLPGTSGFGTVKVNSVNVNAQRKTVTVTCSENAAYIPFTQETIKAFKADILKALGSSVRGYQVKVLAKDKDLDTLVLFADKKNVGPSEQDRFITYVGVPEAPDGLDGVNIAMWQSHGWYFEPKLNRWEWQRARIFQTVEDLYTQGYVIPFLMPMLENAGAYVMSPRERDINSVEFIIDADGNQRNIIPNPTHAQRLMCYDVADLEYGETGSWTDTDKPGFKAQDEFLTEGVNPFKNGKARMAQTSADAKSAPVAVWTMSTGGPIFSDYKIAVYVSYQSLPNSTTTAKYIITDAAGDHEVLVNQKMGGGTWIYLGHYSIGDGNLKVQLVGQDSTPGTVVTADAVKIGGGYGNVARRITPEEGQQADPYQLSSFPRFTEGARYFLQYAGAPDSVYTPSGNVNDYTDDYKSRGLWVNWLAGGSSMLPQREGLNIPVDLSFAFHSDAGTTMNDSIIGTLGIYSTVGDVLGSGSLRLNSRDYTDLVMTNIVNDIRATYEPNWTRRGMWDKSYFEAREPQVPAMLLELLSHQNFADMKYGLDPEFRFLVSRAIYKGMLQFLAHRDGRPYVVQPLPVKSFAISPAGKGKYTLSWEPTEDALEESAMPTYYLVQHSKDGKSFATIQTVNEPRAQVEVNDSDLHAYRIVAGNSGGRSFPSEVLALSNGSPSYKGKPVLLVNGFTRISAPDWFDAGEIAGFYDARDGGVPYMYDISKIGSQFEYRRVLPWADDDAAGFGASYSDVEDTVLQGNTFDFTVNHGSELIKAGIPFYSKSAAAYSAAPNEDVVMVDLIMGKQKEIAQGRGAYGTKFKTFPTELQDKIRQHTASGTNMLVSGSFIATDLWDNAHSDNATKKADQDFARDVLGYQYRVGQATNECDIRIVPNKLGLAMPENIDAYSFCNELYLVESPDALFAADGSKGSTILRYSNNLPAGIFHNGTGYKTVVVGVPLEKVPELILPLTVLLTKK